MGLCLLFDTIEVFEELTLAFLLGDLMGIHEIQERLTNRCKNMDSSQVWNDDFVDAFALSGAMRLAFRKHGNIKIAEAHVPHPRHNCTLLEETDFEAVLTEFDSSTTGIGGFLDDLPASERDRDNQRAGAHS